MRTTLLLLILPALALAAEPVQYHQWTLTDPILTADHQSAFDNIAVKDPSILHHQGRYHLFYTAKSGAIAPTITHHNLRVGQWSYGMSTGHVAAPTLEALKNAPRTDLFARYPDQVIFDPHVFYFEPHQLWYMVAHKRFPDRTLKLAPVYLTSQDLADPNGWSEPREIKTAKSNDQFWIDFWVICDDRNAHMFYSNQQSQVFRMQCPLDQFPHGFANARETLALSAAGRDGTGQWLMFEGAQVYHVQDPDCYLFLGECKYRTDAPDPMVDAKRRFIIAMTAPALEGPWTRLENHTNDFFIQAANIKNPDGSPTNCSQVSLPALLRSHNQTFDVPNFNLTILFQTFDATTVPDTAHYNELPWRLALIKNH